MSNELQKIDPHTVQEPEPVSDAPLERVEPSRRGHPFISFSYS